MTKLRWEKLMTNKILQYCMNQNNKNQNALSDEVKKFIEKNGCSPQKKGTFFINKGVKEIGKGEYGTVYLGYLNKELLKPVAIKFAYKETLAPEVKIMQKLKGYGVPRVYDYKVCKDGEYMFYQYASKGSLYTSNITEVGLRMVIAQILYRLYTIHKKCPSFRHNDLHTGNVLITQGQPQKIESDLFSMSTRGLNCMIHDFGLSTMNTVVNPKVTSGELKKYGIYENNDMMYDVSFFLTSVYYGFSTYKSVQKLIEELVPMEYLMKDSKKMSEFRMRPDVDHSSFPTYKQMFENPFFNEFKKPQQRVIIGMTKGIQKNKNQIQKFKNIIQRAAIKPKSVTAIIEKAKSNAAAAKSFMLNKDGNLKHMGKKCKQMPKPELVNLAKKAGLSVEKASVKSLVQMLEKKYIPKV